MAANNSTLYVGDAVKVCIDSSLGYGGFYPIWLTDEMKKFDGEEFIASRIWGKGQKAYELKGVNNKHGNPYSWMRDALIKLKQ